MDKKFFEKPGIFLPPGDRSKDRFNELYLVNSDGYRTREFADIDWNNSIVVFGCSNVFGTGLAQEETLASRLEQMTGLPVINMGQPGTAIFYSFYNQLVLKEMQVTPKAVINVWTSTERITYFGNDSVLPVGIWSPDFQDETMGNLFKIWTENHANSAGYSITFQRTARMFWNNVPHLEATWFPYASTVLDVPLLRRVDAARDGGHPGVRSVYEAAKVFYGKLKDKLQ